MRTVRLLAYVFLFMPVMLLLDRASSVPIHAASANAPNEVAFGAVDYGFSGPEQIPAGLTTIRLTNSGKEVHHVQLLLLTEGKTAADFVNAMKADPGQPPAWAEMAGGPNAVAPMGQAAMVTTLRAGTYVLVCWVPDQSGVSHVVKGMLKPLTVVRSTTPSAPEPTPTRQIDMRDFSYTLSAPITAGVHTIRVNNQGGQPHEVVVVRLPSGGSVKKFAAGFEPGAKGPPRGQPIGGIVGLEPNAHGFFTGEFAPGRYGLICFFPDDETGALHFKRGMTLEFSVP